MGITDQYQKNFNKSDQRTIRKNAKTGITRGKSAGPSARRKVNRRVQGNNTTR